jgi:hypothetical protein
MEKDRFDTFGPLLNEIGEALADLANGDPNGIFFYVEIGEGWIQPSLYKEEADVVRWLDCDTGPLLDLIEQAWRAEPKERRWSVMEYSIADGKFSAAFKYPEEVDVESFDEDRREKVLVARYGDKQIFYPPMPEGSWEL